MNLKKLREQARFTQKQLADMLGTTQQTVARWESGKVEPNIAALRDLAVIYGTSIDDILGQNPLTDAKTITSNHPFYWTSEDDEKEFFWGHLGVRFPGQPKSTWYPITLSQADHVSKFLANADPSMPWVTVRSLNNRLLLLNVLAVPRLALLDDNADQPDDDWELTWDGYEGLSQEFYPALAGWFTSTRKDTAEYSGKFKEAIENIVKKHDLDEDTILEQIISTCVIRRDGIVERIPSEGERLWALVDAAEHDALPAVFALYDDYGEMEIFFPAEAVCCVDMPLHEVMSAAQHAQDGLEKELKELEDEPVHAMLPVPKKKRGRPRKIVMGELVSEGAGK